MKLPVTILILLLLLLSAFVAWEFQEDKQKVFPLESSAEEKPLDKYTFDALTQREFIPSKIELGNIKSEGVDFTTYLFFFEDSGKRVSGQINIPEGTGPFPIIVMYRGYVEREIYRTGTGTERAAEIFAGNGFVTIAPDFLGYGSSDEQASDEMEERFQTYTTAITLIRSVENLNQAFYLNGIDASVDVDKIGIWGHSNGGQISISILEITGENIPTVLWAPVTKPFPYSILYYADEFDDRGKYLRKLIAQFEENYDVDKYSIERFFNQINAPVQLYQGSADDFVPQDWSDEFVAKMEELDKEVEYFIYSGADHNLLPNGWNGAVASAMEFYRKNF